jgi:lipopolysaccharide/colanic/teichoic acid biosynthesis glycosyltransferase
MREPPIYLVHPRPRLGRRIVDISVVLLASVVALPLLALLACLVKLTSRGPVFFAHERLGYGGRRVRVYKLRTMVANADEQKQELMAQNSLCWPDFKIVDDARVTRLGFYLRKFTLDELPQLYNVLRGDITLVGPRPCSVGLDCYELWQTERLDYVPGLFGRWQAEGRSYRHFSDRCRVEIAGSRARTVASAIGVSLRTAVSIARARGAH